MTPQQRDAVVTAAARWLRTPWHHNARVLGAGVDCAQFVIAAYVGAGLIEDFSTGHYPADWMLHNSEEKFLWWAEKYLDKAAQPLRGDVVLWKFGRCFSHGGIVVEWPEVIHSYRPERGVVYGDGTKGLLAKKPVCFFTGEERFR